MPSTKPYSRTTLFCDVYRWQFVILWISLALPNASSAKGLTEENVQIEFCVTYLPCQIAVGMMESVTEIEQRRSAVANFFQRFGQRPARTEKEYREWLTTITSAERQQLVERCIDVRGKSMLDWCESSYLLENETSTHRSPTRPSLTDAEVLRFGNEELKRLRVEDENLLAGLKLQCRITNGRLSDLCATNMQLIGQMQLGEREFNSNTRYRDAGLAFQSEAVLFFQQHFEWKERERMWIARQSAPEAWTGLPSDGPKLPTGDMRSVPAQPAAANGFVDPFSGTSKRLEPASIDAQRLEFQREQASARRFTEVFGVVAQAVLDQRIQQQTGAGSSGTARQRIYSDDPIKHLNYIDESKNSTQRMYSDNPAQQHPSDGNSKGDKGLVYMDTVNACVRVSITEPMPGGGHMWIDMTNTCAYSIKVKHSGIPGYYGSLTLIRGGGKERTWHGTNKIFYLACPEISPVGTPVFSELSPDKTGAACSYRPQ